MPLTATSVSRVMKPGAGAAMVSTGFVTSDAVTPTLTNPAPGFGSVTCSWFDPWSSDTSRFNRTVWLVMSDDATTCVPLIFAVTPERRCVPSALPLTIHSRNGAPRLDGTVNVRVNVTSEPPLLRVNCSKP